VNRFLLLPCGHLLKWALLVFQWPPAGEETSPPSGLAAIRDFRLSFS
jgi:hypothetical protein